MTKRKIKKRNNSLEERFKKELKTQQRFRLAQFLLSDNVGKAELIFRAMFATNILKTVTPFREGV